MNHVKHVKGTRVRMKHPGGGEDREGLVVGTRDDGQLLVQWLKPALSREVADPARVVNGFANGSHVLDATPHAGAKSLGEGVVMQSRVLAGSEQVLVDFPELGQRHWLPYQHLRAIRSVKAHFEALKDPTNEQAERCRLRLLAYAITIWQENTGALARLDIDPLPHQINLVHHILNSGNLNWLIADDVGLGKTIEAGMLLHALNQRNRAKRVLLITPAGLTRQWQDELYHKFRFEDFRIFGVDFHINAPWQWKGQDRVIASLDTLKQAGHLESILQADTWDLIIFDEAHRLSRRQYGLKLDASERFQLAQALRTRTEHLLLLSATPHQGMQDKFVALLELLRPERKREFDSLALNPEILTDMVFRNHKADVTDAEGNFIFQGKSTHAIHVPSSPAAQAFDRSLQQYLRKGYEAGRALGRTGQAIGFVMTVYRKLAASSAAAIHQALCNRFDRLATHAGVSDDDAEHDERFEGEFEESHTGSGHEFFEGERELLQALIDQARELVESDRKVECFLQDVISEVLMHTPEEKVLIFTEYKSTQRHLQQRMAEAFGSDKVELINGSMDHGERQHAIRRFETDGQFLISTEAGGEGINLQRQCHVMVNFDLPWNPMRLVQRIGRLYRYGQKQRVVVFNMHQSDSLDLKIIELMYSRIETVVNNMATVSSAEFNEGLKDEILGEFAELVDIQDILEDATLAGIDRSAARIDEALRKAKDATERQRDVLSHAASGNQFVSREIGVTLAHLQQFAEGMFTLLGIEFDILPKAQAVRVTLSESLMRALNMAEHAASRMDITFNREVAASRFNTAMMDMEAPLMKYLVAQATHPDFGGHAAGSVSEALGDGVLFGAQLRWQSVQGRLMRRELLLAHLGPQGEQDNSAAIQTWLLSAPSAALPADRPPADSLFKQLLRKADDHLAASSNAYLLPQSRQMLAACWTAGSSASHEH